MNIREKLRNLVKGGLRTVSAAEAEDADMVICVSGQHFFFTDNVFTVCADCGGCIQHRPEAPERPPKLCLKCAHARVQRGKAEG